MNRKVRDEPVRGGGDGSSLPRWFYFLAAGALALALALPVPAVKYAIAATLGIAVLKLFGAHPESILFVFILVMPGIDLLPPDLIPIPGLNPITIYFLMLWWATVIQKRRAAGSPPSNPMVPPVVFHAALLALSALSSFFRGVPIVEHGVWVAPTALDHFADWKNRIDFAFLAPISFRLLSTPKHVRTAVRIIAVMTLLVATQSLWDVRNVVLAGLQIETNRAVGILAAQPNLFGGFLALVIAILVPLVLAGKVMGKKERIFFAVVVVVAAADLLFTLSRGSWLALLVGLSVLALFRGAKLVVLGLLVASTAPLWLPETVVERVELTREGANDDPEQEFDDSTQVRVDQWKALPSVVAESPIYGHGMRSFPSVWFRVSPDHRPKAAHSAIIELTAEEGLLGVFSYGWLVGALLLGAWRARKSAPDAFSSELALGLMCAAVCLVLLDSSGTRFRSGQVMAYLWVVGGAVHRMAGFRAEQAANDPPESAVRRGRRSRAASPGRGAGPGEATRNDPPQSGGEPKEPG